MDVVVTGIGLVSALGVDTSSSWQRLIAGDSAIALRQPFPDLPPCPLAMLGKHPAALISLTEQVVCQAIENAHLTPPLADMGVVLGSSRGHQATWERWASQGLDNYETSWLEALPHGRAIAAARYLQTQGPVLSPMAACATGLWAVAQGMQLIQSGQCQRVLVGAIEAPITPLTLIGFSRMGALAQTGCYPFDAQREGLVLGEGGAAFVLESLPAALDRSAPIYGRLLGVGLTADGHHVSAPDPTQHSSQSAIRQCLQRSRLDPTQIDYIHAHGTSTRLNDTHEAGLIQHLFPSGVPVSSTKGATGHTLGASGALGLAFSLLALRQQILPPCTGLSTSDYTLNFVMRSQPAALHYALCLSFGFGGQNAVISLGTY